MELITHWSEEDAKDYGKKVMIVEHALNETGLFTDEALADMLDNHPSHLIDFQYVVNEPDYPDRQVTVDFTGADGKTMVAAAKSDLPIWINVREVMNRHPQYREVLDQLHTELEKFTGRNRDRKNCRGGILISSKSARTPYHADPTMTHLWHIRGHKKAWVYPKNPEFLPDEAYESIILGEVDEDIPWTPEMDEGAIVSPADLHGGELVLWPNRSPHRVENETYCISMVMEFSTKKSAFTNAGMFFNGVMRRKYGLNPSWYNASAPEKIAKAALGRMMSKIGGRKNFRRKDMVRYRLVENTKDFIQAVATPYERVH
jgi:hypothetical protein